MISESPHRNARTYFFVSPTALEANEGSQRKHVIIGFDRYEDALEEWVKERGTTNVLMFA